MTHDGGNLCVGLGTSAGDAEVWQWNGTTWTKIGGDSGTVAGTQVLETVYTLKHYGGQSLCWPWADGLTMPRSGVGTEQAGLRSAVIV